MAATVNTNVQAAAAALSPRSSSEDHRLPLNRTSNSPPPSWNQVVRGPELTPPVLPSESPVTEAILPPATGLEEQLKLTEFSEAETLQEGSDSGGNGNGSKKPAWNKPSNGAPDSGPVMGAISWPTLFESTKASPKPPSVDSSKNFSDAPVSAPQVVSATAISSPASSSSSAPQRPVTNNPNNPNPNATPHHGRPARQKSMKREGGGNPTSNGVSFNQPPQSSSLGEASHDTSSSSKTGFGGSDVSRRDHGHNNSYREGGGQRGGGGGDHPQQRSNYRRSNSGPHLRGDGSFGGRRDQDRANHEWNHHRSFNGRDPAAPPQRGGPRGYIRPPPPGSAPYIPPPIRPYGNPMGIPPEMQSMYFLAPQPGMPFVAQMPPAVYFPPPDPQLHVKIINQIDYYFSNENLIRDTYLRQNMDEHGWVPVQLIAGFKKVMQLTTDVQLILDVLQASTVVEIQGDRIRRRDDWMRWIMPPSVQYPAASGSQSPTVPGQDTLAAHVQGLAIDVTSPNQSNSAGQVDFHTGTVLRSSSGDMVHADTSKDGRSTMSEY